MAMSPSSLLAKLDELKQWQQEQQARLLKQHTTRLQAVNNHDFASIVSTTSVHTEPPVLQLQVQPKITPNVDMARNAEVEVVCTELKPKQPFLKRGAGLHKFGLQFGDHKKPFKTHSAKKPYQTAWHKRLADEKKVQKVPVNDAEPVQKNQVNMDHKKKALTPLKLPQIEMLPKAKWCPVPNLDSPETSFVIQHPNEAQEHHDEESNASLESYDRMETPVENAGGDLEAALQSNPALLFYIQKLATAHFGRAGADSDIDHSEILSKLSINEESTMFQTPSNNPNNNDELINYLQNLLQKYENNTPSDMTTYEKALDKELQLFEKLEEKVMHSSFCSTNSSVAELLASTPNKALKVPTFETIQEALSTRNSNGQVSRSAQNSYIAEEGEEDDAESTLDGSNAKKKLTFEESDASSVTSGDFDHHSREIIVRQNAATMTDPIDEVNEELMHEKLQKLEAEVNSFRTENRKIEKLKAELERQRVEFQRAKRASEKELQERREELEYEIEQDRKHFQKEKLLFERQTKEVHNKPNRKEREEITSLKTEIANLRETLKVKETRNGTSQARLRNQIKCLEKETANLKNEVETLQKQNARLQTQTQHGRKSNETKMLQEINKNLSKLTKEQKVSKVIKNLDNSLEDLENAEDSLLVLDKTSRNGHKKVVKDLKPKNRNRSGTSRKSSMCSSEEEDSGRKSRTYRKNISEDDESDDQDTLERSSSRCSNNSMQKLLKGRTKENKGNDRNTTKSPRPHSSASLGNMSDSSITENFNKVFGAPACIAQTNKLTRNNSLNDTQQTMNKVETILPDGAKQTKYPNGNTKTVSADGNHIKMEYFNGDIKETQLLDGTVKYYYMDSRIWQTTYRNGEETFEFPDGQIEKHFTDGTSHMQFPNGIVKNVMVDGSEKISYPDGSIVTISKGGEKVLLLPNGQKEIHTEAHKRREYPDGTVKIIYPDGLQETRYSNGRIRMKDKDGVLLMDSHKD